MLQKNGFKVYLIGEYKTYSLCPSCGGKLDQKFKQSETLYPYQHHKMPTVKCHGLARCRSSMYSSNQNRLWNRDLAAVLNFRKTLTSLRQTGRRPTIFSIQQKQKLSIKVNALVI
ncbi:hypothetical protein BD408DRAFT_246665 [Parasitella parasitica]|nr:hypothetical protein BD408DRAFT_246665 [Parasitella parasitica]